jgi:hypothetical protein
MDGQSSVAFALFVKALIIALGAATGVLAIAAAVVFGATLVKGIGKVLSKAGRTLKRKPAKQAEYV